MFGQTRAGERKENKCTNKKNVNCCRKNFDQTRHYSAYSTGVSFSRSAWQRLPDGQALDRRLHWNRSSTQATDSKNVHKAFFTICWHKRFPPDQILVQSRTKLSMRRYSALFKAAGFTSKEPPKFEVEAQAFWSKDSDWNSILITTLTGAVLGERRILSGEGSSWKIATEKVI